MVEYFRDKVSKNGIIFLQETHSSEDALNKWRGDFQRQIFFPQNCEFLQCNDRLSWKEKNNEYVKIRTGNNGRIIVLAAEIDSEIFLLINLYNPSSEAEQVN